MTDAADAPGAPTSDETLLDERYGRGRTRAFDKRFGWVAAGALMLGGVAFLVFGGWQQTSGIESKVLDYSVMDGRTVQVEVQVTIPAGADAICAIEALSESYATVGWRLVELPRGDERTRRFTTTVVTTSPATTGTVRECWTRAL